MADEKQREQRLRHAQRCAAELFVAIEEEGIITAGRWESEASAAVYALAAERFGVQRHWHRRVIRSGPNTLRPYQHKPPDRQITGDDIVFADLGPVFEGWEADFGRTWLVGKDPLAGQLVEDLPRVFDAGRQFFEASAEITSEELFGEVVRLAHEAGWEFGNYHCGHLVGEFPHENFDGQRSDSLIVAGNDKPMRRVDPSGRVAHWILEIHLVDRQNQIGGFYEDLLTIRW